MEGNIERFATTARNIGIALIVLGLVSIFGSSYAGTATSMVVAVLLVLAGSLRTMFAWIATNWGYAFLRFASGLLAIFAGVYMLANPDMALQALTIAVAVYLAVDGISQAVFAFQLPPMSGSAWVLLDGALSVAIAALIWIYWPQSADWAVGVLVGVKLLMDGVVLAAAGAAVQKAAAAGQSQGGM